MTRSLFFFIFSEIIFAEAQECGGDVDLFAGYISSPGFDDGEEYANRLTCTWTFPVEEGVATTITFDEDFGIEAQESGRQCFDKLQIKGTVSR